MSEIDGRSSTRGLATLAMLKTNFDRGRDHLSMFEPFVDDTLVNSEVDAVSDSDIQRWVAERHQLTIPLATIRTLAGRAVRRGLLRREGGRYFANLGERGKELGRPELRSQIEARQGLLADDYRAWASEKGVDLGSRETALQSLIGFIENNHVRLALSDPMSELVGVDTANEESSDAPDERLPARFLRETIRAEGQNAHTVAELLEGYVLQNTLLLKDVSSVERRYAGLRVFFDSGLLFGALGLHGDGQALLTKDLIALLREEGAKPEVFVPTLREMRRVLAVYETRLGTAAGRKSLHQTELTRYLLNTNATPSDVRVINAGLENSLKKLGVAIVETPDHIPAYTLDESDLSVRLASRQGGERDPRVVHDVDCVASVLTFRRGNSTDLLDSARAIFVTSSQLTVTNVVAWYENEEGTGIPPIAHLLTVSNLTWLKRPGRAASLKLEELIALCSAALRPSRKVWAAFVNQLERLETSGELTSDEVTVIMASSLTDQLLADAAPDDDPDADSLTEVVDRVKASLAEASERQAEDMRSQIHALQGREARQRKVVAKRARLVGKWTSWLVSGVVGVSFIFGTIVMIVNIVTGAPIVLWAAFAGAIPLAIGALLGLAWGFNVRRWREHFAQVVTSRVERWLSAEQSAADIPSSS